MCSSSLERETPNLPDRSYSRYGHDASKQNCSQLLDYIERCGNRSTPTCDNRTAREQLHIHHSPTLCFACASVPSRLIAAASSSRHGHPLSVAPGGGAIHSKPNEHPLAHPYRHLPGLRLRSRLRPRGDVLHLHGRLPGSGPRCAARTPAPALPKGSAASEALAVADAPAACPPAPQGLCRQSASKIVLKYIDNPCQAYRRSEIMHLRGLTSFLAVRSEVCNESASALPN
jgi:hypothetical protein